MIDIIIKNGQIIDGTGAEPYVADIGIDNGKIVFVGRRRAGEGNDRCKRTCSDPRFY